MARRSTETPLDSRGTPRHLPKNWGTQDGQPVDEFLSGRRSRSDADTPQTTRKETSRPRPAESRRRCRKRQVSLARPLIEWSAYLVNVLTTSLNDQGKRRKTAATPSQKAGQGGQPAVEHLFRKRSRRDPNTLQTMRKKSEQTAIHGRRRRR